MIKRIKGRVKKRNLNKRPQQQQQQQEIEVQLLVFFTIEKRQKLYLVKYANSKRLYWQPDRNLQNCSILKRALHRHMNGYREWNQANLKDNYRKEIHFIRLMTQCYQMYQDRCCRYIRNHLEPISNHKETIEWDPFDSYLLYTYVQYLRTTIGHAWCTRQNGEPPKTIDCHQQFTGEDLELLSSYSVGLRNNFRIEPELESYHE
ncbi:hypothetical protein RDWZM_001107 [Blomia tropicalis]|uniref:Uncharacterized protein n=1 Tax=Blomia tropicalis TaxID=40697 RepID=A0A9Q0MBM1_BLOTA|nr:hypothetical protein RDWZM_001107 [Blomia tropicalis]